MSNATTTPYALRKVLRLRDMDHDRLAEALDHHTQMQLEPNEAEAMLKYVMDTDSETITRTIVLLLQSQVDDPALLRATVDTLSAYTITPAPQQSALAKVLSDVDAIQSLTYVAVLVAATIRADPAENVHKLQNLIDMDISLNMARKDHDLPHELVMLHVAIKAAIDLTKHEMGIPA